MSYSVEDIEKLVEPARVHRKVYTDEEIFDLEMERVWGRTWIFAGHASEVPNGGDYKTFNIGSQSMLMVRNRKNDNISVFYNRCTHKGAKLVGDGKGCAKAFRCPYHAWTFDTEGKLLATPPTKTLETSGFAPDDPEYNLRPAAQVDIYHGFVFVNLDANAEGLHEYFGDSLTSIDNMVERSPEGELEMAGGVLRYRHDCNWKSFVENLNDNMHPMATHQSAIEACQGYAQDLPEGSEVPETVHILGPFGSSYDFFEDMSHVVFKNGHSYSGNKVSIHSAYPPVPDYVDAMETAYGKEKTKEIFSCARHNTVYYPSLTIKGAIQAIRVVRPISVNCTDIETYTFRLKGAPDEMLQRTLLYSRLINSPSSIVGADDLEVYERVQAGLHSHGHDWVSMERQKDHDQPQEDGSIEATGSSELPFRNQYKYWLQLMTNTETVKIKA
ncbi:MAG: aromatic ring-hydroxylating dioxygenase subunit alpha [Cellvibrionaceae bacterium]|nr:aromatic ring-hydroxylating dioxygenase subunit alpha [Cellvibrionaceae bacterium]